MKTKSLENITPIARILMKRSLFFLGLLVVFAFQYKTVSKQDFKKEYQTKSSKTTSIVCDYVQTKTIKNVKNPLVSKGKFYFSKPGKIRWEQQSPKSNIIVIAGDSIYMKEDAKVKRFGANENPYFKYLRELMLGTVSGNALNEKYFNTSVYKNSKRYKVELVPKSRKMKRRFTKIVLKFAAKDLSMMGMEMHEKGGDKTIMEFLNPVFNTTVSSDKFKL